MSTTPSDTGQGASGRSTTDPVVAVIDFEAGSLSLQPADILRYSALVLLVVVVAAATAFVGSSLRHDVFGVRSEVLFERRTEQSTGFLREDRSLSTQLVTLRSRAVLGPVASANGLTVEELSDKLEVSIVDSSEVIRIQVNDRSVARATALVGGITDRFVVSAQASGLESTEQYLEDELDGISVALNDASAAAARLESERQARATSDDPNPAPTLEQTQLNTEIASLLDQATEVRSKLDDASIELLNRPKVVQLTDPYRLEGRITPRPALAAIVGGLAGAFVAAMAVALLMRRRGQRVGRG